MAKPTKIMVEGKDFFAWPYEKQTQIKHRVLSSYAKIWLSKLGQYKNTIFFDCHGGCGAYIYSNNTIGYGSSILVNKLAQSINKTRTTKTGFYYCETDKKLTKIF